MIRNKIYIIAIFTVLMGTSVVHAQQITTNDVIKTKIFDWSVDPITLKYNAGIIKTNAYKDNKKCGNISFDVPSWVSFRNFRLIIKKKLSHDDRVDFLSSGIYFSLDCTTKVNLSQDNITFNDVTKQWELSKEIRMLI